MNDFERLLNSNFPFVEDLLSKYGEFFPLACAVKINDEIAQIGAFDGNEKPGSANVLANLKQGLKANQNDYRTVMIFYDILVKVHQTNEKKDAVAVFAESKEEESSYIFYYPYKLTQESGLFWQEPWKEILKKEIFNE